MERTKEYKMRKQPRVRVVAAIQVPTTQLRPGGKRIRLSDIVIRSLSKWNDEEGYVAHPPVRNMNPDALRVAWVVSKIEYED